MKVKNYRQAPAPAISRTGEKRLSRLPQILSLEGSQTNSQSTVCTGVSPVQTQAKACDYQKLLFECNSVSNPPKSPFFKGGL
jgi:hypothetical protein